MVVASPVKKKRKASFIILLFALALAAAGGYGVFRAPSLNIDSVDPLKAISPDDRLLVFSPHCDDEVLGPGALIMDALRQGAAVKVVLITNGDNNIFSTDIEFRTLYPTALEFVRAGEARQRESLHALALLGVHRRDIIFLGYPDRGIHSLYGKNRTKPYRAHGTKDSKAPYRLIYQPGVVYTGDNLSRNIKEIITSFSPTIVAGPHLDDHHPDHRYSAKFIIEALRDLYGTEGGGDSPVLLTYLVHYPRFPRPRGLKPDGFILPPFTDIFDMQWFKLALTPDQEKIKLEAIGFYSTQTKVPELGKLLKSFVRKNELFEQVDDFSGVVVPESEAEPDGSE